MKEMQKTQSPAIHDINGNMFQDNLKQLTKHQKTRLHRGEIDASNVLFFFEK